MRRVQQNVAQTVFVRQSLLGFVAGTSTALLSCATACGIGELANGSCLIDQMIFIVSAGITAAPIAVVLSIAISCTDLGREDSS